MSQSWCTIESDPGVFSELIQDFGVSGIGVEEVYDLGQESLTKSYGLVFLFKWRQERDDRSIEDSENIPALFFAKQIIPNACATQAILSVLFNADGIQLGETLDSFKQFTSMFDAESKGLAISNSDTIRAAHNSYSRPEPFLAEESSNSRSKETEDAYHFIAYLPFQGAVYELDGLKDGPIKLGADFQEGENWWDFAKPAIEARMSRYSAIETHFALLNICEKKSAKLQSEIGNKRHQVADLDEQLGRASDEAMLSALTIQREALIAEIGILEAELHDEHRKSEQQHAENIRRKHNFLPFIISLLRSLSVSGSLKDMISDANSRRSARQHTEANPPK